MAFKEFHNEDAIKIGTDYSYLKITTTKLKKFEFVILH